jgi:tRNA nucleotidyltransferase (CCA-adding enzyme)
MPLFYFQCAFSLFYAKIVHMNIINLYENYNSYFNEDLKVIFENMSKIASKSGFKIYLVGGIVRDILLNVKSFDIDITVEGDAVEFAKILKNKINAKIISEHKDFGTVKVVINGQKIDLASTRSESYPKSGHLPHVDKIGCSLKEDVLRRDFTVNSLAMALNKEFFADLIDYVDGFNDLKNKKIKILHEKSFIDDPTRIIRALKYSTRLGFELDEKTLKLQEEYLQNINYDMCYKRIKQEIKKTFDQNSQEAFDKFIEQGIYKLVTNCRVKLLSHRNIEQDIKQYNPKSPWLVYFGVLLIQLQTVRHPKPASSFDGGLVNPPYVGDSNSALNVLPNIAFTKYEKEVIQGAENIINEIFKDDFEIYKVFSAQKLETLLILAVLGKKKEVLHYLNNLQKIRLHINGDDLIKIGLKPSKEFNGIFDYVLKEKFKNPKLTKKSELELVKKKLNIKFR